MSKSKESDKIVHVTEEVFHELKLVNKKIRIPIKWLASEAIKKYIKENYSHLFGEEEE